ncbi:T9SS type B sorting domain-containing protein [Flavobacterium sp. CBA20B-1]|uniref:T9SS type B sorting domain-containing protein n=1 Tax=unclassified Flavobacterium TaxID=196869 RepID=UPI00222450E8|nr:MULTISPECIES: T9SS type B sorting domain-containing protein [unclassified Flavobacterium]WCM41727.1 T9SS type B sorting domain-containing protein [Flavobacterium sp. CBA20B-1]
MRNKYLLILFLVTSFLGFSQQYNYVAVDATYTPDELVKDVLVRSQCDLVSNVRYQNGDGSPQAQQYYNLAYFNQNGSTFPFEDGVVLCTDSPAEIPGPSLRQTSGVNGERWAGDQTLNDAINNAGGGSQPTYRSTQLEFDFIPVQSSVTFDYLFASNSYHSQCGEWCENGAMFAAWLIDTTTGVGQNLALVPNTTDPISINTVRDVTKSGGTCANVNPLYMGNVYAAPSTTPALSAPINYIGHTVPMTSLTANVIVGRKYTIKLAVIDFCPNNRHSSAAFFKAGSFDIGNLDLGNPVLIENGEGLCVGDSYTLQSGLDPNLFTFEWFKDGVQIPGQTGPNLVVTETGEYSVKGFIPNVTGCILEAPPVRIEFFDYVTISAPQNISLCPSSGSSTRFNLDDALTGVTSNPDILFSYYLTQQDAENDTNAISNFYNLPNSTTGSLTIWVRAYELNNPCPYVTSFTISLLNCSLTLNPLPDLSICEGASVQTFDLTVQTPVVYNNAAGYIVTYHLSKPDADTGINAIPSGSLATYNGTNGERIWVRVTDSNNSLSFGVTSFYLYRNLLPLIQTTVLPITACENGNTGLANFDLNLAYSTVPVSPLGVSLEFYSTQQDALLGNTALMLPVNYTGAAGTIYVRVRNLDGDCFTVVPLQLQIINTPVANSIAPLTYCDLNNDGFGEFNLDVTRVLIAGNPMPANSVVTFHETQGDADANANAIFNTGAYINKVKDQQTIYVRVGFTNSSCYNTVPLVLIVNKTPAITPIRGLQVCDINNDGVETVNLRSKESEMLTGLNAANYTVSYHISSAAAMANTGAIGNPTNFSTSVSTVVYVRVTDNTTGCFVVSRINIELVAMPVVANPLPTVTKCDTNGDGFEVFDLASLKAGIIGTQQGLDVSFHYNNSDAQTGLNPLANQYQNVSANVQTIYVRVFNASTGCFVVSTMNLEVKANPVITAPSTPYVICSDSGFGTINIYLYGKALIDATGQNYGFQFFETESDAMNNINNISNPVAYNNLTPGNSTIWIRVNDPVSGCFSVYPIAFQLVVPPKLPASLPKLVECDVLGSTQDQLTIFDLTEQNAALLAAQTAQGTYQIRYFTTQALANSNTNWIVNPTQFQNTVNPQTIWVRIEDTSKPGGCARVMSFQIEVAAPFVLQQPLPIVLCDTDQINDGLREFDLTIREYELFGGQPPFGTVINYYLTQQAAENDFNKIANPSQFYNTVNPQTIYIGVENQYGCRSVTTLTLRVLPVPEPNYTPTPLELCEDTFNSGMATFDLRDAEASIGNFGNYTYTYYVSEIGAHIGPSDNSFIPNPSDFFSGTSQVYVRVENSFTDTNQRCYVVVVLDLVVHPWPTVGPMTTLAACMDNPTRSTKFNLRDKDAQALGTQDPATHIVRYFATEENAEDNVNPLPYTYENTTLDRQQIWVRVENSETGCFNISTFFIQIEQAVYAFAATDTEFCETDFENDGVSIVDLSGLDAEIIGNQPAAADVFVQYERWDGTIVNKNSVQVFDGEVIRAVVKYTDTNLVCSASVTFTVRLKDAPEVLPLENGVVCYEYRDQFALISGHYLETGIQENTGYTIVWTRDGQPLTPAVADVLNDGGRLYVKRGGTYQVVVTGPNGCSTTRTAVVNEAPSVTIDEVKLTDSFGDTNAIEVMAYAGPGVQLEYKLDNGPWQDSNIFLDVTPGEHTVYVRIQGEPCEASKVINVMDYPKYFTPNNDGYNDTWNIWSLKNQPNAKIYIFDRFGKLLKQLSGASEGWDGTFNGKPMPSTDYWFKAEYVDPKTGLTKEVTGHFSLKR